MYNIFSSILNKRLYSWVEENEKLDESQAGFRAGYSTIDNIFSYSAVVQKYLSKRGGGNFTVYMLTLTKPSIRFNMHNFLIVLPKKEYMENF